MHACMYVCMWWVAVLMLYCDVFMSHFQICLLAPRSISKTTSGKIARAWCRKAFIAGSLQLLHRSDNTVVADTETAGVQGD